MLLRIALISCLTLILFSCSKNEEIVYEPSDRSDPYLLYEEGLKAFNKNNFFFANKKFTEAELNFEKPDLAAKSSIMACFSLYGINFYNEAEDQLKMFLQKYPADKHIMYAHYLLAIVYYEQISDEKKDLLPLLKASEKIEFFLKKFPNTDYAIDLKFKQDLILNQLAAKELYIARYYISIQKWIPAINRLKNIVTMYDKTVFIEEALHRLVEINYLLGLQNEANKYAKILGYNYSSSEWFQQSYKVLNKDYEIIKEKKVSKNKDNLLKKIIKMIK